MAPVIMFAIKNDDGNLVMYQNEGDADAAMDIWEKTICFKVLCTFTILDDDYSPQLASSDKIKVMDHDSERRNTEYNQAKTRRRAAEAEHARKRFRAAEILNACKPSRRM